MTQGGFALSRTFAAGLLCIVLLLLAGTMMPRWLTFLVTMSAASLTLGGIHAHIWLRRRKAADTRANLAFAALAIAVAVMGFMELRMMRAATPEEFQRVLLWYHFPILVAMAGTVAFTHYYLNVGRLWLGLTSIGLRTVALLLGMLTGGTLNYQRIDALGVVEILGDPVVVVTEAVASPWLLLSQPALALLVLFLADATRQLWQCGDRTRALSIGAGLLLFVVVVVVLLSGRMLLLVGLLFLLMVV